MYRTNVAVHDAREKKLNILVYFEAGGSNIAKISNF